LLRCENFYFLSSRNISENFIMHNNEVLKTPRFISISISCVILQNAMSAFSIKEHFFTHSARSVTVSVHFFFAISWLYLTHSTTTKTKKKRHGVGRNMKSRKNVNYTNYCQPRRRTHESLKTIFQDSPKPNDAMEREKEGKVTISCVINIQK
jgi:hypothetical protein